MSTSLSGYVLVSSLNQGYARMIAEDVGETERLALVGLSLESIEEVEFNADVFDTTRAELTDTCLHSPFFTRRESG